jgi:hypothetical protein
VGLRGRDRDEATSLGKQEREGTGCVAKKLHCQRIEVSSLETLKI